MAGQLSQEQIQEFKETFALFDRDGDGTVTVSEIKTVMKKLGQNPTDDEVKAMISDIDKEGKGELDFEQFCEMMAKFMGGEGEAEEEEEYKQAFKVFDKDNSGSINANDLKQVLGSLDGSKLTNEEVDSIIEELDPRSSGKVNFTDFCRVFMFL